MDAAETVKSYYATLRRGDRLPPYFLERETTVKIGVSERLVGHQAVAEGLREQTRTTTDWTVDSRDLVVDEEGDRARFADAVDVAWTALDDGVRHEFDTRWTGSLARVDGDWRFGTMHVSASLDSNEADDEGRG